MMNKTLIAGGAMAALAVTGLTGTALATPSTDQIVQAQSFSFDLSPGSQTLAFDQFDDNGGLFILQSVEVQMTASVGAQVQATNTSGIDAEQFGVNIVGNVTVDISDINTTAGIFQSESVPPGDLPIVSGQTW
ncbi:MAG: choice-of-anchor E domain-containing protein, partial [Phycisphaerales bacterium]